MKPASRFIGQAFHRAGRRTRTDRFEAGKRGGWEVGKVKAREAQSSKLKAQRKGFTAETQRKGKVKGERKKLKGKDLPRRCKGCRDVFSFCFPVANL
jgi:hypothetical protein